MPQNRPKIRPKSAQNPSMFAKEGVTFIRSFLSASGQYDLCLRMLIYQKENKQKTCQYWQVYKNPIPLFYRNKPGLILINQDADQVMKARRGQDHHLWRDNNV